MGNADDAVGVRRNTTIPRFLISRLCAVVKNSNNRFSSESKTEQEKQTKPVIKMKQTIMKTLMRSPTSFLRLAIVAVTLLLIQTSSAWASWSVTNVTSVGAQSGTLTYGTSANATFAVTVTGTGSGGQTYVYSVSGLPTGVTAGFSPASASSAQVTSTLSVTNANNTPAGSYTITVSCNGFSKAGTLTVDKATPTATLAVNNSPTTYDGTAKAATVAISASSVPRAVADMVTGGTATKPAAGT